MCFHGAAASGWFLKEESNAEEKGTVFIELSVPATSG